MISCGVHNSSIWSSGGSWVVVDVARRVRDDAIASSKGASGGWARTSFGGFLGELGRGRGILGGLNPEGRRGGSGIRGDV